MPQNFEARIAMDRKGEIGVQLMFDGAEFPLARTLRGRFTSLVRVDAARHGPDLWRCMAGHDTLWTYLFETPPQTVSAFIDTVSASAARPDWVGYVICTPNGAPLGYAYYLNIVPTMGTIEVGNINFSPALQRTPAATEAMYLMMREAFALGYRRYEWKCNALNVPSRRAAQRLGFSWEGIFRNHMVVKGRNRDTAWFAVTDADWPALRRAFETWLAPANFHTDGTQRRALSALTRPVRVARDPDQPA